MSTDIFRSEVGVVLENMQLVASAELFVVISSVFSSSFRIGQLNEHNFPDQLSTWVDAIFYRARL